MLIFPPLRRVLYGVTLEARDALPEVKGFSFSASWDLYLNRQDTKNAKRFFKGSGLVGGVEMADSDDKASTNSNTC